MEEKKKNGEVYGREFREERKRGAEIREMVRGNNCDRERNEKKTPAGEGIFQKQITAGSAQFFFIQPHLKTATLF